MGRGFLQGFQKGIESGLGEHVHLINNVHLMRADLGGKAHLVGKGPHFIHPIVGCSIHFKNVQGSPFVK